MYYLSQISRYLSKMMIFYWNNMLCKIHLVWLQKKILQCRSVLIKFFLFMKPQLKYFPTVFPLLVIFFLLFNESQIIIQMRAFNENHSIHATSRTAQPCSSTFVSGNLKFTCHKVFPDFLKSVSFRSENLILKNIASMLFNNSINCQYAYFLWQWYIERHFL